MSKWDKNLRRKSTEIRKHLEINENNKTTLQNLHDAVKAVLCGKFTAIKAYTKREEKRAQINYPILSYVTRKRSAN